MLLNISSLGILIVILLPFPNLLFNKKLILWFKKIPFIFNCCLLLEELISAVLLLISNKNSLSSLKIKLFFFKKIFNLFFLK